MLGTAVIPNCSCNDISELNGTQKTSSDATHEKSWTYCSQDKFKQFVVREAGQRSERRQRSEGRAAKRRSSGSTRYTSDMPPM